MHSLLLLLLTESIPSLKSVLLYYSICKTHLSKSKTNLHQNRNDYHQDNILFDSLQFYKRSCLYILAGYICSHKQVKKSIEAIVTDSHSKPSCGISKL